MKKTVAVLGATGQTGKHLVQKLIEQSFAIRVLSRSLEKARKMFGGSVEIIEGDLIQVKDLQALVHGVTHLFAVHGADRYPGERGYELIDFGGMDKALDSIPANQPTHIIYMSSIYADPQNHATNTLDRYYWKKLTERMIIESGHPYTIVRPGWLNNNQGGNLQIFAEQGDRGDGKITREDVAEVLVQAMQEGAKGKVFEVYNVAVVPDNNWQYFFSALVSEEQEQ